MPIKSGTIEFLGERIDGVPSEKLVGRGITLVPEGRRVFSDLTVLENIKIGAYLRKDDLTDDINWVYELFPRLKERSWHAFRRRAADAGGGARAYEPPKADDDG